MKEKSFNFLLLAALLFLPPFICLGLNLPHAEILSIFITIIGLWLSEAVPLPVTGLLVPVLAVLYGALPANKAFDSFGSDILFLFLGCFFMSRSMERYGFDKRIAYFLLGRCLPASSFLMINILIAVTSFVLSMWISNTSATAILSAVVVGLLASLESELQDNTTKHRVAVRLLLSCAFAASIGGMATPVGSPPNLIALKLLAQRGVTISFLEWIKIGLPISLAMLLVMLVVFELLFPLRNLHFPGIKKHFQSLLKKLGPMSSGEIQIALIFLIVICLWILPGVLHTGFPDVPLFATLDSHLSMSGVGMLGGLAAFFMPVKKKSGWVSNLDWSESEKVDWGTIMLFGGGLTLGLLLEQSGAAADLSAYLFQDRSMNPLLLASLVVLTSIIMSEFASNTAAASILIPLILAAMSARGTPPDVSMNVVLAITFGASFGFMLPVSTPPNAIVYGTGKVSAVDMRRAGIIFDCIGALLIIGYMLILRMP